MEYEYKYFSLGMMVLFISFLGFVLENMWLAATRGYMDNRNMRFPFLLGYGVLVVGMYLLIGTPQEIVLLGKWYLEGDGRCFYYLMATVIVSLCELILGTLVEHIFGFEYWNYEWIPCHLSKYTSLPTSLGFATIITLFMEYVFPCAMRVFSKQDSLMTRVFGMLVFIACLMDFISSFRKMYLRHGPNERWRIERSLEEGTCRIEIQHRNPL